MLSYIEISKKNVLHNYEMVKSILKPEVKIVAVIKANAYGHGQNEIAQILEDKADYFQVDDAQEFKLLRKVSQKPTLILGYVAEDEMEEVLEMDGILAVYSIKQVSAIDAAAKKIGKIALVHIKIDAKLGRQGILLEDVRDFAEKLKEFQNIKVDGIYSHFANIEDTTDFSHAQNQIDTYEKALDIFKQSGYADFQTHISASSGVMVYENASGKSSLVRVGLALYGMWPSEELKARLNPYAEKESFKLKPALRWVTHVAQVKTLPANYSVGYGLTFVTSEPTEVAIIPQGYSDGYDRGLSNCGEVLITGKRCQILGRVAMNMFVVDVSHLEKVEVEAEVVLLSKQGSSEITAEEIAEKIGTINYEITSRIVQSLPRIIV